MLCFESSQRVQFTDFLVYYSNGNPVVRSAILMWMLRKSCPTYTEWIGLGSGKKSRAHVPMGTSHLEIIEAGSCGEIVSYHLAISFRALSVAESIRPVRAS